MYRSRALLAVLAICLTSQIQLIQCWGEEGHKIVAAVAVNYLSSSTTSNANVFLDNAQYTLPEIAPWADEYRATPQGAWSEPCHFCDLPNDATSFNMAYCPGCCVVKAIGNYTAILTSEETNPFPCDFTRGDEPCALEFLVHYVGDVHQPLHVSYSSDRGGNEVTVSFFGKTTNLHSVWDTSIIEKWNNQYDDATNELMTIIDNNPDTVQQYLNDMNVIDWADESFEFVRTTCYNYTTDSSGVPQLDEDYYNRNLPIVQWRLIAAGVRLASLLNNILGGN